MLKPDTIRQAFAAAAETYAAYGIDTEAVLEQMKKIPISMNCWQGDDVTGLEEQGGGASGGIMSTGNHPGKARNGEELADIDSDEVVARKQRLNLHASYAERFSENVDRNRYETRHFRRWIDWAKARGIALDFNPTCFGHPMAADNLTLAHPDERIRRFWIDHCKASRRIAADIAGELGQTVVNNIWVPDGMKDMPADRTLYRRLLRDSLDEIFAVRYPAELVVDAVECKLFGIGLESFTVGSHEFYMGYLAHARADGNDSLMLTLDMGHFHPTETIADKISSLLLFNSHLLIHVSRAVKWDSDHVVISDENLQDVMREIKRAAAFDRVYLATDFFDGSINRIAAWVIGVRATQKAILAALLEPPNEFVRPNSRTFRQSSGSDGQARTLPYAAVWNQ